MKPCVNLGTVGHCDNAKAATKLLINALDKAAVVEADSEKKVLELRPLGAVLIEPCRGFAMLKRQGDEPWRRENKRPKISQAKRRRRARK